MFEITRKFFVIILDKVISGIVFNLFLEKIIKFIYIQRANFGTEPDPFKALDQ